ncbi:YnfU family zinc-binding protein [Serratia sp. NPDC078593]|uniref:YnfU family zinc-binding protein n=1 Tax=unclassified Serratia (in: enterobacteria) TaxID=2647522 RepID=UPI0037D18A5B
MSDSRSAKGFTNRTTPIACPKCAYVTDQQCSRLQQNVVLICPNCGVKFKPQQN